MKHLKEFKEFAMRGNIIDLAVALIIGIAVGKVISSLVNDIIMPPIGLILGGVDFKDLKWVMKSAEAGGSAVTMNYGMFVQNVIDFLIIAFCIFIMIKSYNYMERRRVREAPQQPPPPVLSPQDIRQIEHDKVLSEVRDLMRSLPEIHELLKNNLKK